MKQIRSIVSFVIVLVVLLCACTCKGTKEAINETKAVSASAVSTTEITETTTKAETTTEVKESEAPSEITTTKHQTTAPIKTTTKSFSIKTIKELDSNQKEILGYVLEICDKYPTVEPAMAMGVIEIESSFNRYADNGTCKGLMQVYENCHRERMQRLGVSNLFDAYSNILVGEDILDEYYRQYGSWKDAIYHYSGGNSSYYSTLLTKMNKYEKILGSLN